MNHLTLAASDLARSLRFYQELGCKLPPTGPRARTWKPAGFGSASL